MSLTTLLDVQKYIGLSTLTSAQEALLTLLMERSDALIKEFVGYKVEKPEEDSDGEPTYTEVLPSRGVPQDPNSGFGDLTEGFVTSLDWTRLFLRELPVREIVSVHANDYAYGMSANWTSDDAWEEGVDFYLDREDEVLSKTGILVSINGNWPTTPRSVKVVYRAGYTEEELGDTNFPKAAILATAAGWNLSLSMQGTNIGEGFGPITREQIGTWEAYYDPDAIRNIAGMFRQLPGEVRELLQKYRRHDL